MRKIVLIILLVFALASLALVLNAGLHSPILLLILFIGWVLSPYISLVLVKVVSKLRSVINPVTFYWQMLFISLGSIIIYSTTLNQHGIKVTRLFLFVPLIAWILIGMAFLTSALKNRHNY